ncbi:MAG: gas vesicle protein K [Bacteroidota bacterium]
MPKSNELSIKNIDSLQLDPKNEGNELIQLVLSLVNTLRELMEKQALRKIESGKLSDQQIEQMGSTFLALEKKMEQLREQFKLSPEDLEIDLSKFITVDGDLDGSS